MNRRGVFAAALWACLLLLVPPSTAQIATDGTLAPAQTFSGPDFVIPSDAGRASGDLLSFSFSDFNVPGGGSATFVPSAGFAGADLVVSRVTGGQPSNILGALRSELGESHFYFLNPAGVFFGPDSSVDVGGSFHLSTADEVRDGAGHTFSARSPTNEVLIARPESFGFLSAKPAAIRVDGSMVLDRGATLDLIGGDIRLSGALVGAPGGQVRFASLAGGGNVVDRGAGELVPDSGVALGAIELRDGAQVSVSGLEPPPGVTPTFSGTPFDLAIAGLMVVIPSNQLQPGDVVIGQDGSGAYVAIVRGVATGDFSAVGGSLLIRDSEIRARSFGTQPGSIDIRLTGSMSVERQVATTDVGLLARSEPVEISTTGGFLTTGESTLFFPPGTYTVPSAGASIAIRTGNLSVSGGARITATSLAGGRGGEITVTADREVVLSGAGTALFSNAQGTGDAGNIGVTAQSLRLDDGAAIIAETETNANGGDISVDVGRLVIRDTSQIDTSTGPISEPGTTSGNGGDIDVRARHSILIAGRADDRNFARLSTFAQDRTSGSAGTIEVHTPLLVITDGGGIAAATHGAGAGGDLRLDVGELRLSNGGSLAVESTAQSADLGGTRAGAAGSIAIGMPGGQYATGEVWLSGAQITASAREGPIPGEPREGNIAIAADDLIALFDASRITASVGEGLGGNISTASDLLVLEGGSTILAETRNGTGGAIAIASQEIIPQLGEIASLQSADFVEGLSGGRISADAGIGTAGTISISSPENDVESQVAALDVSFLDPSSRLQRACAARASGRAGSFRVLHQPEAPASADDAPEFDDLAPLTSPGDADALASANRARAAIEAGQPDQAAALLGRAAAALGSMPDRVAAPLAIHLAKSYELLAKDAADPQQREAGLRAGFELLTRAAEQTHGLPRLRSFALGDLGALYSVEGRTLEALYLTRQAIESAAAAGSLDPLYRWHWQEGRLLWAQGRSDPALRSYGRAVEMIESMRNESRRQYASAEMRFHRAIAPVYLDYVDALLASSDRVASAGARQELFAESRAVMEQYKAAELRDYFRDECVADIEAHTVDLDRVLRDYAPTTAVVYPIALADRLELLVSLPGGIVRRRVEVSAARLDAAVAQLREAVRSPVRRDHLAPAQLLYSWLVAPYEDELAAQKVDTLVFVPDAKVRTISLAVLHDGNRYLLQRYAVAVTPGFSLIDPHRLSPHDERFLLAGLSMGGEVQGERFDPLPKVGEEIAAIHSLFGGEVLLDGAFETRRFEQALVERQPTVVHLASHAVFAGDPKASFVVAHDGPITLDHLGAVVAPRQYTEAPLELLVLSACETASGDDRAALGLAGVAVRAGARSAIGSLWAIPDDAAYRVVTSFYEALRDPRLSKAQALRRAQLALLDGDRRIYRHPYYWSAYQLINNWL